MFWPVCATQFQHILHINQDCLSLPVFKLNTKTQAGSKNVILQKQAVYIIVSQSQVLHGGFDCFLRKFFTYLLNYNCIISIAKCLTPDCFSPAGHGNLFKEWRLQQGKDGSLFRASRFEVCYDLYFYLMFISCLQHLNY